MLKKIVFFVGLVLISNPWAHAGKPLVAEAPFNDHGAAGCVAVSSFSWTQFPPSPTTGRVGIYITVRSTASANMVGSFDNTVSTWTAPIIFKPGVTQYHGVSDQEPFYFVSQATNISTEDACWIETKQ